MTYTTDRMSYLTAEQLGATQSLTPDGFLLCVGVPIARTGVMSYAEQEIPEIESNSGVIDIERSPDEVFREETLASFEGKPVTVDHPYEQITPANWAAFARGHAMNIRRGEGDQADLMLADLLITDARAIAEVRNGLREVSAGYTAEYDQVEPGRGVQRNIIGNHIALVEKGRCGPRCAIGDTDMTTKVAGKNRKTIADKLRALFMSRDADGFENTLGEIEQEPEDVEGTHVHLHMHGTEKPTMTQDDPEDDDGEDPAPRSNDPAADPLAQIIAAIAMLNERINALEGKGTVDDNGSMEEDMTDEADPEAKEDEEQNEAYSKDSAAILEIQQTKARAEILCPGVKLPTMDAKATQKQVSDALCALRRSALTGALSGDHSDAVAEILGGAEIKKMSCDALTAAFNGAAAVVKAARTKPGVTNDQPKHKDINARNKEFWANAYK